MYNISELREALKDYYGTSAVVIGGGNPFDCIPALGEMFNVDDLSDEEVIEEARKIGII